MFPPDPADRLHNQHPPPPAPYPEQADHQLDLQGVNFGRRSPASGGHNCTPNNTRQLQSHGVVVTGQIESTFLRDLLSWVVPVLLFVGVWMFMLKRTGGDLGGG